MNGQSGRGTCPQHLVIILAHCSLWLHITNASIILLSFGTSIISADKWMHRKLPRKRGK